MPIVHILRSIGRQVSYCTDHSHKPHADVAYLSSRIRPTQIQKVLLNLDLKTTLLPRVSLLGSVILQIYLPGLGAPISSSHCHLICFGLQMNHLRQVLHLPRLHLTTCPRHSSLIHCPHPFPPYQNLRLPFSGRKFRQRMMTVYKLWQQVHSLPRRRYLYSRQAPCPGRSARINLASHLNPGYGELFAESIPKAISEQPLLSQQHPVVSEFNELTWSLQEHRESTLDLPFVSPDVGTTPENDIVELIRGGDWESIREAGVDVFNAEYAMINSESRLRRSLSGDGAEPASKF
jgi:hypothetical protein